MSLQRRCRFAPSSASPGRASPRKSRASADGGRRRVGRRRCGAGGAASSQQPDFRVYTNDDVIGVELGGALKNVMAVATGIVEGVGLGFNSRAALITRGLAEMTRLGVALGARAATFAGLAGVGDLVLTCTGALSRNRAVGVEMGKGATLEEALRGQGDDRGRSARRPKARCELARARRKSTCRSCEMVHRILFEGHAARNAVPELMARELRAETD